MVARTVCKKNKETLEKTEMDNQSSIETYLNDIEDINTWILHNEIMYIYICNNKNVWSTNIKHIMNPCLTRQKY